MRTARGFSEASAARNAQPFVADDGLPDIVVSKRCAERLQRIKQRDAAKQGAKLRVTVESGGCSGFQYTFHLTQDTPAADDRVFARDGQEVIVDETSLELIKGSTVDFVESDMSSAFAVTNNPHAEKGCGCGTSFALKET